MLEPTMTKKLVGLAYLSTAALAGTMAISKHQVRMGSVFTEE